MSQSYSEALKNESASEHRFVSNRCLIGLYVPLLLTTGFGFANDSEHIYVLRKIAGQSPGIASVTYSLNLNHFQTTNINTFQS